MSSSLSQTPAVAPAPLSDQERWFQQEVHAHDSLLKAYLHRSFPTIRDVEDVVQESYLRVWKTRATRPIQSAKAFLFTVARRVAIDLVRRDRRSPFVPVQDLEQLFAQDGVAHAGEAADSRREIELVVAAIEALPTRCREIFVQCQVEGRAQKEVAARLGLSENTVAVQSARGLQRCEEFVRRRLGRA